MTSPQHMRLPHHTDPTNEDRIARAPYNFVRLPENVVTAVSSPKDLPDHCIYLDSQSRHTGYFDVTLTTKSPLYIRSALTLAEFTRQGTEDEVKNKPDFFYVQNPKEPVIPGSSLRGMLRALVEIVSFGKLSWVTDRKLFFRTVESTVIGDAYRGRMGGKVEAGFIKRGQSGFIIKVCRVARVHRDKLGGNLYQGLGPNWTPPWQGSLHQWQDVWVRLSSNGITVQDLSQRPVPDYQQARLVITGDAPKKKKEFVFLLPEGDSEEIAVPESMLSLFHDDDQITQWQEQAFSKSQPQPDCRVRNGMIRKNPDDPGDPIFFLRESGQLTFFGRAQMFRLPYNRTPRELVPYGFRRPDDVDFGEALFGFVRTGSEIKEMRGRDLPEPKQGTKELSYAGRVFVTDANLVTAPEGLWLSEQHLTPHILATPKPTSFQHYLTQQEPDNSKRLDHYDSPPPHEATLRGHKLYWHKGAHPPLEATEEEQRHVSQLTRIMPVKPGVVFSFRVYFENLSDEELGALAWALQVPGDEGKTYYHKMGMGKPLGMGSVKLDASLILTNRLERYRRLFDGNGWATGAHTEDTDRFIEAFNRFILESTALSSQHQRMSEIPRIRDLLTLMEWHDGDEEWLEKTRYMLIQHPKYRERPVLPTPQGVL